MPPNHAFPRTALGGQRTQTLALMEFTALVGQRLV